MKLKEVLDHLTFNQLSQHRYGGYQQGHVQDVHMPHILSVLNQGMREIAAEVHLFRNNLRVKLRPFRTTYTLTPEHASTAGNTVDHYIQDTAREPFTDDIIKIIEVKDEKWNTFPINVRNDPASLATPRANTLQFPFPKDGETAYVEYVYVPAPLVAATYADSSTVDVVMPSYALSAWYEYTLQAMTPGLGTESAVGEDNFAMQKYMQALEKLKLRESSNLDLIINERFQRRGFV